MTKRQSAYTRRVRETSEWLVKTEAGDLSAEEKAAFANWQADIGNTWSYERSKLVWDDIAALNELSELQQSEARGMDHDEGAPRVRTGIWSSVGGGGLADVFSHWGLSGWAAPAGGIFAMLMLTVWVAFFWNVGPTSYATETGEIKEYVLADGSHVTMAAKSSMTVSMDENERRVLLSSGDAFFSVSKDPARPFIVVAGNTRVQVVGTRFNVHHGPEEVRVAVEEGIVNVAHGEPEKIEAVPAVVLQGDAVEAFAPLVLTAGQKIVASHQGPLDTIETVRPDEAGLWRQGRLRYNDVGLAEIVADANRYLSGEIILSDESLRSLRLTTSFRTDEVEQFVATLDLVLPVKVRRELDADGKSITILHSKS